MIHLAKDNSEVNLRMAKMCGRFDNLVMICARFHCALMLTFWTMTQESQLGEPAIGFHEQR